MPSDNDKMINAMYSMNEKLERIENALWLIAAFLLTIILSLAFPEWRGIFG